MNGIFHLLHNPGVTRLGWVLMHFIWQGTLVTGVAWGGCGALAKVSSNVRYVFLCLCLVACVLAPVITWHVLGASQNSVDTSPDALQISGVGGKAISSSSTTLPLAVEARTPQESHLVWTTMMSSLATLLPYVVLLWSIGIVCLSIRHLIGLQKLNGLRISSTPLIDKAWIQCVDALAQRMEIHRTIQILESSLVQVPAVIGIFRPVIFLPVTFFTGLSSDQAQAILLHELAHIRRHDFLVNLFQIFLETIFFFHPGVRWISFKVRQEREYCCDDLVLALIDNRLAYASALALLEESRDNSLAISMAANGGSLLDRIRRMLGYSYESSKWPKWMVLGTVILSMLGISLATYLFVEHILRPGKIFTASNGMEMTWVAPMNGWAGRFLVTQEQYLKVMGVNPSKFKYPHHPVESVSWYDAIVYCRLLTERDHASGILPGDLAYTLPTDEQWSLLVGDASASNAVTSIGIQRNSTEPAGTEPPNQYGLYDTLGNVWEWCLDWYQAPMNNSQIRSHFLFLEDDQGGKTYKVVRGGSWLNDDPVSLDTSCRGRDVPVAGVSHIGFRVVATQIAEAGEKTGDRRDPEPGAGTGRL